MAVIQRREPLKKNLLFLDKLELGTDASVWFIPFQWHDLLKRKIIVSWLQNQSCHGPVIASIKPLPSLNFISV